jgi:hypothetical protein
MTSGILTEPIVAARGSKLREAITEIEGLDWKTFQNPSSEFRGAPLWSWNNQLDREQLLRQIDYFKAMGLGGFHIHVRTGLDTEYLGSEFLDIVRACVLKAKDEKLLAWLYDEDRWPSGFAGGRVTENEAWRAKYVLWTQVPYGQAGEARMDPNYSSWAIAGRNEKGVLLARYEVELRGGYLAHYRCLAQGETARPGTTVWYAYLETMRPSVWYNGQAYADMLNPEAVRKFMEVTHEAYAGAVGEFFGTTIPAIFTDEPQLINKKCFRTPEDTEDLVIPWTTDFAKSYEETYGEKLTDHLPELFWEWPERKVSTVRYRYHDHLSERFVRSFADQVGGWCESHGLALTGHVMEEPKLGTQTAAVGEAMRSYRSMQIPGIDMLADHHEYTTAKQAQSAARQYGRRGVMSEIYGVTNWDFDFVGHKGAGDWQAALGVTVRVHHLTWVSMAGEAKRDYPASIGYQSPWYREYGLVEDHFARLNTLLTRGRPRVKVGVLHPIESYWLCFGPLEQTAGEREQREANFQDLTRWLLFGLVDFDFIAESLLPALCPVVKGQAFPVGEMAYDVVIVPGMKTIRATTLDRLEQWVATGGRVIFAGEIPSLVEAVPSDRPARLAAKCTKIPWARMDLLRTLEPYREVEAILADGQKADSLLYQMREEAGKRYIFLCNTDRRKDRKETRLRFRGDWTVTLCDTETGNRQDWPAEQQGGWTSLTWDFPGCGSVLFMLEPGRTVKKNRLPVMPWKEMSRLADPVAITLSEPNVLVLDQAEWKLNSEDWQPREEILRIDNLVRRRLGLADRSGNISQPWVDRMKAPVLGRVALRFVWESTTAVAEPRLALENSALIQIQLDGTLLPTLDDGWWVDEAIRLVRLPAFAAGHHELILHLPFSRKTDLEWCYLLGDFGVEVSGRRARLIPAVRTLAFGDWTRQGLPFYAGNVTYHCEVEGVGCPLALQVPKFKAPLLRVSRKGGPETRVAFPPFLTPLGSWASGRQPLDILAYGNRINAFGTLHNANEHCQWYGPGEYRTEGVHWAYEYQLKPMGILTAPLILTQDL